MKTFLLSIFKDTNDINEKNFIGVLSFFVMVLFALADMGTGLFGVELVVTDHIYNSFLIIVLGAFSISGVEKIMGNKNKKHGESDNNEGQ